MTIHEFQSELWLPLPPAELFPFYADAANLDALTPPWMHFHIVTPPPIEMKAGALIDYRLRAHGLPLRWRTRTDSDMTNSIQTPQTPVRRYRALAGWILLCFAAASFGGLFMPGEWYADLKKPSWNPPGWLFGPVWTALYTMMAVAAWLVWKRGGFAEQRGPLTLFLVQLTLNAAWTPLFFGLHWPGAAFAEIVLLWFAIAATIAAFRPVHRVAAWLLAPYLAWVSFAAVLNFTLWRLNR